MNNGISTLGERVRQIRKRFTPPGSLILLYHRVNELTTDPQLLSVTPKHFEEQMEVLKKYEPVVPLNHLAENVINRDFSRRAVAITFDDGYADNLQKAKPILERFSIPATVFVATGHIDSRYEFWWDDMERIFLQPGKLPETIHFTCNGDRFESEIQSAANYNEDDFSRNKTWNVQQNDNPTPRHAVYREVCRLLRPLDPEVRQEAILNLTQNAQVNSFGRKANYTLTGEEVKLLETGGLIEIGAHTVTHPVLSALDYKSQKYEIEQSKARLEDILGHDVLSFSYPYGSVSDYSDQTLKLVKTAGFKYACSNFVGLTNRKTDRYQLPRILVRDWNGDEFERRLKDWLNA